MSSGNFTAWLRERNRAFESDDLSWAASQLPPGTSKRVVEIAFHKARLACTSASQVKRDASETWLAQNGYSPFGKMGGMD